jgi:hypothetical protein
LNRLKTNIIGDVIGDVPVFVALHISPRST